MHFCKEIKKGKIKGGLDGEPSEFGGQALKGSGST